MCIVGLTSGSCGGSGFIYNTHNIQFLLVSDIFFQHICILNWLRCTRFTRSFIPLCRPRANQLDSVNLFGSPSTCVCVYLHCVRPAHSCWSEQLYSVLPPGGGTYIKHHRNALLMKMYPNYYSHFELFLRSFFFCCCAIICILCGARALANRGLKACAANYCQ